MHMTQEGALQAWQEEEDARKRREESNRRWRARTASSQGPDGRNALAAAARALNVDTDADERQIK